MNQRKKSLSLRVCSTAIVFVTLFTAPTGCGAAPDDDLDLEEAQQPILGGDRQLDYYHPWLVSAGNCNGVLIHPEWILTAAHCAEATFVNLAVGTTDRVTGEGHYQDAKRNFSASEAGLYLHPEYVRDAGWGQPRNDIALVRVKELTLSRYIQTAALPDRPLYLGERGVVARRRGDAGSVTALPMNVNDDCPAFDGAACVHNPEGALCEGDSGSGFIGMRNAGSQRFVYGAPKRATVIGIVSFAPAGECEEHLGAYAGVVDVYQYKDWILDTIAGSTGWGTTPQNELEFEGNVTARVSGPGAPSPGELKIECEDLRGNPTAMTAPMDVPGVGLGVYCQPWEEQVRVGCGTRTGSLSPYRVLDLTWNSEGESKVGVGTNRYVSMEFSARDPSTQQHVFTCRTGRTFSMRWF